MEIKSYLSNPRLKRVGQQISLTQEQLENYIRCANDPVYFIEHYMKVVTLDKGLVQISLYDYQKEIVDSCHNERKVVMKMTRQSGKTTTTVGYILWYILFNEMKTCALLANKERTAREILSRVKLAYENLPLWMQQGVEEWNKGSIDLENGSKVVAASTSSSAIRGMSINCISGDSEVLLRIDGVVIKIKIKDLYENFANSPKYNKANSVGKTAYVQRKQIQEDIFQIDGERIPSFGGYDGETPHNPEMLWREKRSDQYEGSPDKSSLVGAPSSGKNGGRWEFNEEVVVRISQNVVRKTIDVIECIIRNARICQKENIRTEKNRKNWFQTFRRNQTQNLDSSFWEKGKGNVGRDKTKTFFVEEGEAKIGRTQEKYIKGAFWQEKNSRAHSKNQQQPREDQKNCRKASWDEEVGRSQEKNERKGEGKNPLEQRIEILTNSGFKQFEGISKSEQKLETIRVVVENGSSIICTEDHMLLSERMGWIKASDCLHKRILTDKGYSTVIDLTRNKNAFVYDILNVEDEKSFFADGILVHNCLYMDEFAFVPNNIADEFFSAVYPTISSGTTSKIIISSTPNGMNHFYKICTEAKQGRNGFKLIEVDWRKVPGRDEKWAADQRATLGEDKFLQEMEGEFLGSAGTLISTSALKSMSFVDYIQRILGGLDIYRQVEKDKNYVLVADTARGTGLDYSAFVVVDIDVVPYRIVAKYRNNVISPLLFPDVIVQTAKYYNNAYLLIENNDAGGQVADHVLNDLEYDNLFYTEEAKGTTQLGQKLGSVNGVRTTKKVKRLGCNALKTLIENQQLIIEDYDIINELATFILKRDTYQADDGCNDDLAMCLVLFAWMTTQPFFRDLTDTDIRKKLFEDKMKQMEEEMLPTPTNNDELQTKENYVVEEGVVWEIGGNYSEKTLFY